MYHQYEQVGGDAVDFVRRFYNKSYPEAMEYLLGGSGGTLAVSPSVQKEEKPFVLPPKNDNMRRVFAYLLNRRGIDREVLYAFVHKGMIYESADYHNAVFVGFDSNGKSKARPQARDWFREQLQRQCVRQPAGIQFPLEWQSDTLYLFEAPIDMLSFISMQKEGWRQHSYAASCSVSDRVLFQMLKDNPNIRQVVLCLDSDEPGQTAAKRIADKLFVQGTASEILVPVHKDWNEDLLTAVSLSISKEQEVQPEWEYNSPDRDSGGHVRRHRRNHTRFSSIQP